jgi:hypothetical protein
VLIPASRLWLPDSAVLNAADSNIFLSVNPNMYAMVSYDGTANLVYSVPALKTRCKMV